MLLSVPVEWMRGRQTQHDHLQSLVTRLVSPTLRRPGLTTLVAVCLSLLLLYPALNQQPDIIWTEAIPDDSSSVVAMQQADENIGGALAAYVMITWPEEESFPSQPILAATAQTQRILRNSTDFNAEFSVLNLLAVAPGNDIQEKYRRIDQAADRKLDRLLQTEKRALLVSARVPNDGAFALNRRLRFVEAKLNDLADQFPGYQFTLTGTVVAASKNMNAIIVDLARSLAVAAALIFVVFAIAFRSLTIGCLTVIPNVLPLLVAASSLHLLGLPLQITAAVTFSLCLGLAVDDTIHVLMRFRSVHDYEPDAVRAMEHALTQVGPALVVTTLILLGGFLALMTSPLPSIRLFSVLSAAILIAALVGDLLLFPAMLVFSTRKPE
jgi:predicted RND superfamily exporter protein